MRALPRCRHICRMPPPPALRAARGAARVSARYGRQRGASSSMFHWRYTALYEERHKISRQRDSAERALRYVASRVAQYAVCYRCHHGASASRAAARHLRHAARYGKTLFRASARCASAPLPYAPLNMRHCARESTPLARRRRHKKAAAIHIAQR